MIRSLRWRLQIWYTILLVSVVGGFGVILYLQTRASKLQEIDNQLEAASLYLEAALRSFPNFELDGPEPAPWLPKDPLFVKPKDKKGPKGMPFEPDWNDGPQPWDRDKEKKGPKWPLFPKSQKGEKLFNGLAVPDELQGPAGRKENERTYFIVWRANGTTLKAVAPPDSVVPPPAHENAAPARPRTEQRGSYREVLLRGPRDTRVLVGRNIARQYADLNALALQLVGIGAAVLVVGLAGGYWLSGRIFRPIGAISSAAAAINATNLSTRIDPRGVDVELAGLAQVLNAMFDRLEAAFERQRQFTADASHELRTPLAILRAHAELALSQARSPEDYRQTIDTCLRAVDRMSVLVQGLLTLARADAGNPGLRLQSVRLDEVVVDSVALLKPLAAEREITLTADVSPAVVNGDAASLGQLVSNLVSNAIQHNHAGVGKVHVRLERKQMRGDFRAMLTVADNGPGIAEDDRPRIFQRFFRVDKARARASGGNGLGLAICKAIADAHGARIDFTSTPSQGTEFQVVFPPRPGSDDQIKVLDGKRPPHGKQSV